MAQHAKMVAALRINAGTVIESLANADEVKRPVEDIRNKIKQASRLQRLLNDAPELKTDYAKLAVQRQARKVLPKGRNFH